ncbi:MAG: ACT domain-containing protein [Desulfovibrio sp.]|jgi:hypothetical protein|nr:ACT domain-containing protein [Desulfovibrio sp.]
MIIDQISVFVENNPGRLAEIADILGKAGIDMRAMSIADTAKFGILRLIVNKTQEALALLRAAECVVSITPVLAVVIKDVPGSLAAVLRVLSDAGINVEYGYAFVAGKQGNAYVVIRVEDNERAAACLAENGIVLASADEIYG